MTAGKTIALTTQNFVSKVMFLFFNTLSRLVIAFPPRSKDLLISWVQSPSKMILEHQKIKSAIISTFSPSICHEMMGSDAMILVTVFIKIFKGHIFLNMHIFLNGNAASVCVPVRAHTWTHAFSVMSNSLWHHELQPLRLFCAWDFPGKNAGVDCHFLLQGIFPTQGWNPCLLPHLYW